MAARQSAEAYRLSFERALERQLIDCDCTSREIEIDMLGLDDATAIWSIAETFDFDDHLMPYLRSLNTRSRDWNFIKVIMQHFASARSIIVATPSCGAGKFRTTLLPIIDAALKIKLNYSTSSTHPLEAESNQILFDKVHPSMLIIEPDVRSVQHTLDLLRSFVDDHGLPLVIKGFLEDQGHATSIQPIAYDRVDVVVCTADTALGLEKDGRLCIEAIRYTFWDSAPRLFGTSFNSAAVLLMTLNGYHRSRYVFTAPAADSHILDDVKASGLKPRGIHSESKFSAPIDLRHHHHADAICEWERKTTVLLANTGSEGVSSTHNRTSCPATSPLTPRALPVSSTIPTHGLNPTTPSTSASTNTSTAFTSSAAMQAQSVHPARTVRSLMHMPRNVRDKILEYVVVEDGPIEMTTFKVRHETWVHSSLNASGPVSYKWNYEWYAVRKSVLSRADDPPITTKLAIAQVNKELAHEVLPMIYGNMFRFDNASDMNTFLLEIGSMRKHVQLLCVQDPCSWNTGGRGYERMLMSLWPAMNLQYIAFNGLSVGSATSPGGDRIQIDTFAKLILPILRRWHEENEAHVNGTDVLDFVHIFEDSYCARCSTRSRPCRASHANAQRAIGAASNFRRIIARELGLSLTY